MTGEKTIIMNKKKLHPDRTLDYFRTEWKVLALITVSGLIYNLGLMAGSGWCSWPDTSSGFMCAGLPTM